MKKRYFIYTMLLAGIMSSGCSDTWDEHYKETETVINNTEITIVDGSLTDYLAKESSLSSTYQLLEKTGMIEQLQNRDQLYTILAVNGQISRSESEENINDEIYLAQNHISDVSLSPSNIADGQRILMWSGKYLSIGLNADASGENTITFNKATVEKVVKLNNGYVYILNEAVNAPRSMYETIQNLGEDYSIFKEWVLKRNQKTFVEAESTPVGFDNQGRTVYDSVFVERATYFEQDGFDLMSENVTATMFIPSNNVITSALNEAKSNLASWNLERADSVLENWIVRSAFYAKTYTRNELETLENPDLSSIFKEQWRTTVQQLDLNNPVEMSNGIAYYVTSMKIPTNVLIYRLKDVFYNYEKLTAEEKEEYFKTTNLSFSMVEDKGSHTGWPAAGFPAIPYKVLRFNLTDADTKSYTMDFTPFQYTETSTTTHTTTPYIVPAGTYTLSMGFEQTKGSNKLGNIKIYVNGEYIGQATEAQHEGTSFHYDRSGGGYPEGYDPNAAKKAGVSKETSYGRDGGTIGTVTLTKTGPIVIRYEATGTGLSNAFFYHWCLKPTKDCY